MRVPWPTAPVAAAEKELLLFPEKQAALNMTDPARSLSEEMVSHTLSHVLSG